MKDEDYFPELLGGRGQFSKTINGFPYKAHVPFLKEGILVPAGYHLANVFTHFLETKKSSSYIEMGLHHCVSFLLYSGCYLFNFWETGAIIAFIHDLSDIPACALKVLAES